MAGLYEERLNRSAIDAPAAGSNSQIEFPADRGKIHQAIAVLSLLGAPATEAEIKTHIPQVTLNLSGDDYSIYKTDDVFMLDRFYGEPFTPGELPLRFSQEIRRTIEEVEATAFIPGAFVNPYLMYEYDATLPANATLKQLLITEGIGQQNRQTLAAQPARGVNHLIKHYRKTINILTSGAGNPNTYRFDARADKIRALHFKGANITEIKILVDGQERWHYANRDALNARLTAKGTVPQADYWHIAWETLGGSIYAAFDQKYGNKENIIDVEITTSSTADVELLAELYNKPKL